MFRWVALSAMTLAVFVLAVGGHTSQPSGPTAELSPSPKMTRITEELITPDIYRPLTEGLRVGFTSFFGQRPGERQCGEFPPEINYGISSLRMTSAHGND